jgi:hypothetical protein
VEKRDANGAIQDLRPDASRAPALDPTLPVPCTGITDEHTRASCEEAQRGYYAYRTRGYRHRQHVFTWQLVSSLVILVVVLLLVFVALYFAAVQFHATIARPGAATQPTDVTAVEASLQGIKVTSPILGVIILVIAFAFFYLYLRYVYPINETF